MLEIRKVPARLKFDSEFFAECVSRDFAGRLEELQDAWAMLMPVEGDGRTSEPHLSTLYNWLNGKGPGSADTLFQLAALLDLDPIALFNVTKENLPSAVQQLVQDYLKKKYTIRSLGFLATFFEPNSGWPPEEPIRYFEPPVWSYEDFLHDPEKEVDTYAAFCLSRNGGEDLRSVYHFAYRRALPGVTAWIPFGLVIRLIQEVFLIHSSGYVEHQTLSDGKDPTIVETWFGHGAAEFRVACVHPFHIQRVKPPFPNPPVRFLA